MSSFSDISFNQSPPPCGWGEVRAVSGCLNNGARNLHVDVKVKGKMLPFSGATIYADARAQT